MRPQCLRWANLYGIAVEAHACAGFEFGLTGEKRQTTDSADPPVSMTIATVIKPSTQTVSQKA